MSTLKTSALGAAFLCLLASVNGYAIKMAARDGIVSRHEHAANLTAEEVLSRRGEAFKFRDIIHDAPADKRQVCTNPTESHYYEIIGDGNPHQNFKIAQVEDTITGCPGSVAIGHSHTFEWSFDFGANVGTSDFEFASLGFAVGESDTKSVERAFECDAGTDMTEICALHYTAVTAVTVSFHSRYTDCTGTTVKDLGTGTVYLPNANGIGSIMARGVNYGNRNIIQCRGTAARELLMNCGPKGNSDFWGTTGYGPYADQYRNNLDPADCFVPIEANHYQA